MSETDHLHDDIDTPSDLHDAMIASLDRRGVLGQIKSRIRAEVFHTIEDKSIGMQRGCSARAPGRARQ